MVGTGVTIPLPPGLSIEPRGRAEDFEDHYPGNRHGSKGSSRSLLPPRLRREVPQMFADLRRAHALVKLDIVSAANARCKGSVCINTEPTLDVDNAMCLLHGAVCRRSKHDWLCLLSPRGQCHWRRSDGRRLWRHREPARERRRQLQAVVRTLLTCIESCDCPCTDDSGAGGDVL